MSSVVMPKSEVSMLRWVWLSVVVIVLDQLTKYWADSQLQLYLPQQVVTGFNLTLSYNSGAAFSFLADAGGWQRWFFVVLALGVATFIVGWLVRLTQNERWMAIALTLILGGAVGNVIDRAYFGHVIDFIQVFYVADSCLPLFSQGGGGCYFPTFNIADSAICIGAVMMVIDGLRGHKKATS